MPFSSTHDPYNPGSKQICTQGTKTMKVIPETHSHLSFHFGRVLLIGALLLYLMSTPLAAAHAASWVVSSSVACPPGLNPSGASYLSWSGYWSWDYGTTTGGLWYWQNGSWVLQNSATTIGARGSSGSAYAYTGAARQPGYWTQTGGHTATFFSGSQNSYAPIISC